MNSFSYDSERYYLFADGNGPASFTEGSCTDEEDIQAIKEDAGYIGSFQFKPHLVHRCEKQYDAPWPPNFTDKIRNPALHTLPDVLYAVCSYIDDKGTGLLHRTEYHVTTEQFRQGIAKQRYRQGAVLCPMQEIEWHTVNGEKVSRRIPISFQQLQALWPRWESAVIVFTADSFEADYPEPSRSYSVGNGDWFWDGSKGGVGLFGHCLDGVFDPNLQLNEYLHLWKIEYCYITQYKQPMEATPQGKEKPNHA